MISVLEYTWRVLFIITCMLCGINRTNAQRPPFDGHVIQKWKEYELFTRKLQGAIHYTDKFDSGKNRTYQSNFKQNLECTMLWSTFEHPAYETYMLSNSLYSAELKKTLGSSNDYTLVQFAQDPNGALRSSGDMPLRDTVFFETSPHFSYWWTRLGDVVTKPDFQIKKISEEIQGNISLIRIDLIHISDELVKKVKKHMRRQGSIYFEPSRYWCIRRVKETEELLYNGVKERTMKWDIQYEVTDHESGFPLIKSTTIHFDGFSERLKKKQGGTMKREYEFEINDTIPDSEFMLSAFGLPEPVGVSKKKAIPAYLWILFSAGVCAALALGFRHLARRKHANSSS